MRRIPIGAAIYDPAEHRLLDQAGVDLPLRPKSLDVLHVLVQSAGTVVSRDTLLQQVWGSIVVTDDSLIHCVSDIRRAIGDFDKSIVRTISKRGYLLQIEVPDGLSLNQVATTTPLCFGREKEQFEIVDRLGNPECRLLVVQGLGGVGKTSLIKSVLPQVDDWFSDGVYYVSLVGVGNASLIPESIALTLGVSMQGALSPLEQIAIHLHGKRALIVLDNFDDLVDGAAALQYLVAQVSGLKLLVGSRVPLTVPEAWTYNLRGLVLPQSRSELRESAPYRFFIRTVQRTRASYAPSDADDETIYTIIQLVGGLPLGIEVVAGWMQHLSAEEALRELQHRLQHVSDGTNEQQPESSSAHAGDGLAAVLQHSWQLCTVRERAVLLALSLFQGSFTRADADAVTDISLEDYGGLIGKSMLHRNADGSYTVHELIRQYASGRHAALSMSVEDKNTENNPANNTAETPASTAMDRYISYIYERVRDCDSRILDGGQLQSINVLKSIHSDIRACLALCQQNGDAATGMRFCSALSMFWMVANHWLEGRNNCEAFLSMAPSTDSDEMAGTLVASAGLMFLVREQETGASRLQAGLKMAQALGNISIEGRALSMLAWLYRAQHRDPESIDMHRRSMQCFEQTGNAGGLVFALASIGHSQRRMEEYAEAEQTLTDCLERTQSIGLTAAVPYAQLNLGKVWQALDQTEQARVSLQRAVDNAKVLDIGIYRLPAELTLGWLEFELEAHQSALIHFTAGAVIAHQLGARKLLAQSLAGIALCKRVQGEYAVAARLLSAADNLGIDAKNLSPFALQQIEQCRAALTASLTVAQLTQEQRQGQSMSIGQQLESLQQTG